MAMSRPAASPKPGAEPESGEPAQRGPGIRLKRIQARAAAEDGARILVDRLWPHGISKERAALTLWCREGAEGRPSDR